MFCFLYIQSMYFIGRLMPNVVFINSRESKILPYFCVYYFDICSCKHNKNFLDLGQVLCENHGVNSCAVLARQGATGTQRREARPSSYNIAIARASLSLLESIVRYRASPAECYHCRFIGRSRVLFLEISLSLRVRVHMIA